MGAWATIPRSRASSDIFSPKRSDQHRSWSRRQSRSSAVRHTPLFAKRRPCANGRRPTRRLRTIKLRSVFASMTTPSPRCPAERFLTSGGLRAADTNSRTVVPRPPRLALFALFAGRAGAPAANPRTRESPMSTTSQVATDPLAPPHIVLREALSTNSIWRECTHANTGRPWRRPEQTLPGRLARGTHPARHL